MDTHQRDSKKSTAPKGVVEADLLDGRHHSAVSIKMIPKEVRVAEADPECDFYFSECASSRGLPGGCGDLAKKKNTSQAPRAFFRTSGYRKRSKSA